MKARVIREFALTATQRKALARGMKNLRTGKTLSYDEFVRRLGFKN